MTHRCPALTPWDDMDLEALLAQLTIEEKAALTAGADMWSVAGLPERGIPSITMTDGPNGARGASLFGAGRVTALCVPCGTALGATWDPELVTRVGEVLGEEARTKSARVLLAPTINLPRSPLFGRSFECFGEDPLLSGKVAAGFVRGVQSRGVAATAKHFLANETEIERTTSSSEVDARTLHEIYLLPFEIAIREGGVLTVMTAYNRVNGEWCAENEELLGILRDELGFDGVVMTDWLGVASTVGGARAGLDLQMPGPARFYGEHLASAVRRGDVPESVLDVMARRWLTLVDRLGAWDDQPAAETAEDLPAHRSVARRAASDATVLLKNDGLLPLPATASVALIGPCASTAHLMGGGSANLRPHRITTIADVLRERLGDRLVVERGCSIDRSVRPLGVPLETRFTDSDGTVVGETVERDGRLLWFTAPLDGLDVSAFGFSARGVLRVAESGKHRFTLAQAGRARLTVAGDLLIDGFASPPPHGTELHGLISEQVDAFVDLDAGDEVEIVVEYSSTASVAVHGVKIGHEPPLPSDLMERAEAAAAKADVAVVVVGTSDEWESEGHDRATLQLPGEQDELVRRVCAANPRTVVVVNAGAPVQMDWSTDAGAVLVPWLGGEEMAAAVTDILLGDAEPAGRLPVSVPARIEHTPSYGSHGVENHQVRYGEGLLTGYRWYTTRHLPAAFPFGHGLSYTTFAWGEPTLSTTTLDPGSEVVVEVPVTNTGSRRGAEVVQLYVEPPATRLFRPLRELKAFAKVWLEPGETAVARLALDPRSFAYWDPASQESAYLKERLGDGSVVPADGGAEPVDRPGWYVDAGRYVLALARSSVDVVTRWHVDVAWSGLAQPAQEDQ